MRVIIRWKPWKPATRWIFASAGIGVCVAALAVSEYSGRLTAGHESPSLAMLHVPQSDLVISQAGFAGDADDRRLVGILQNRSDKTYTDVTITFSLVQLNGDSAGSAAAKVAQIGAHATANFAVPDSITGPVEVILDHIEATPVTSAARR